MFHQAVKMSTRLQTEALTLVGFGVVLLLLTLVGAVAYRGIVQLDGNARTVRHTQAVLTDLNGLLAALSMLETSQRGYVITADESFVSDFHAVQGQVVTDYRRGCGA